MPSPSEGEEWIEIYNSEVAKDIGGLIIADKLGAVKQYVVPDGTTIVENGYMMFYKKDTGITLNDDGDGVVLIDATGKVFDDSGDSFGKATKGLSYAFTGGRWVWTTSPTPGATNRIAGSGASEVSINSTKREVAASGAVVASQKGTVPTAEVLGATSSNSDIFSNSGSKVSEKEKFFGLILIGVALGGGLVYTLYVNRRKLNAAYRKERKRYVKSWKEFRAKLPRR
jgi:hypothetical protein